MGYKVKKTKKNRNEIQQSCAQKIQLKRREGKQLPRIIYRKQDVFSLETL